MQEFFAALLSFFLIEPLQAEMEKRIGSASRESMAEISTCIRDATPVLIRQASEDPWQTATHVFGIWSGVTAAEEVLVRTTPTCERAVTLLRPSSGSRV